MKLTKAQIALFCDEVQKWRDKAGLYRWSLSIGEGTSSDSDATCWTDLLGGLAVISIRDEWDEKPTDRHIAHLAFHEVMELLLSPLTALAEERFCTANELEIARHEIIHTLAQLLWNPQAPD